MIIKLLKLPLKLIALPAALCLFLINVVCAILIGIGSLFTNLAAALFIFGAAAEWMAGMPDAMAYQCLGLGLFFLIAPHIASWIIDKASNVLYLALGFLG